MEKLNIQKTIEKIIAFLLIQIENLETQINDWSSRVYKKTAKKVYVGTNEEQGDTPWEPGIKRYSTNYLNEKRRNDTIRNFKEQIEDIKHTIEKVKKFESFILNHNHSIKSLLGNFSFCFKLLFQETGGKLTENYEIVDSSEFKKFIDRLKAERIAEKKELEEKAKNFDPNEILDILFGEQK